MAEKAQIFPITIRESLIRDKIMCPIIIFAVSRNPRVIGRTEVLKNSMIEINGASHKGVPKGRNCPKNFDVFDNILEKITVNHVSQAALSEKIVCTVVEKKYGFILMMFRNRMEKNSTKMKEKASFKWSLLVPLSCSDQTDSNMENKETFFEDLMWENEKAGVNKSRSRIIPVGKILRNWFVAKSKEENRSFIMW